MAELGVSLLGVLVVDEIEVGGRGDDEMYRCWNDIQDIPRISVVNSVGRLIRLMPI